MEPLEIMLVGCGMMGARHVRGMAELNTAMPGALRLRAVCDLRVENAEKVAAEAESLLGERPAVFSEPLEAVQAIPDIQAADLVTDPRSHDEIARGLFEAGLHVLCEKPLALTVERGRGMIQAAKSAGRVLATAENNRRDPMNRLARACIDAGIIGLPNFMVNEHVGSAEGIIATAWRHQLAMGGVIVDVAIHMGYIMEALLGPIEAVTAQAWLTRKVREGSEYDGTPVRVEVDSEDAFCALVEFGMGAHGQWSGHFASPGETAFKRLIVGSEGTVNCAPDRSGRGVEVRRGKETLAGEALLECLPDYRLNEIETRLFGDRPGSYALQGVETDRKLIAAELWDFADAIGSGRAPEVDGVTGLRGLAIIYAVLESALAGRTVLLEEVLAGSVRAYQDTVDAAG